MKLSEIQNTTAPTTTPVAPTRMKLSQVAPRAMAPVTTPQVPEQKDNLLASMVKGLFSAPATIAARPFQLGAELLMPGDNRKQINEFSDKYSGGLVAPVPENFSDVKKDIGRGIQTVALGTGAPIAGGAAFGVGHSLEQGNDLLSLDTAFQAATGGALGKVVGIVGKPLLSVSGKVIGTITPQVLKDVAAGGAQSIQKFMKENQLLGGIAAPASEKIAAGFQKVDDAINSGTSKVFGGAKDVVKEQYPGLDLEKRFTGVNEKDIIRSTTVNEPKYSKSTKIYNEAKDHGIDLEKVATKKGIQHDKITDGNAYNTLDTADNIREGNFSVSETLGRPAIKAAESGVRLVPVSEVRSAMLKKVDDIPSSQVDDETREFMRREVMKRYGDNSPSARAHPNGYSLTELHDARIVSGKNGKYKPGADASTARKAELAREEGRVFADIFDKTAPEEAGLKAFRRELEEGFRLADYLEALHNKKTPDGITKKAVRLFGRATAATLGGKIGGFPGSILGAQYGDMLFGTFETLPNPLKSAVLNSLKKENPKAFEALKKYIGEKEVQRLETKALPASGDSSFNPENARLFSTPGGKSTPIKQEAVDVASVESGKAKKPGTDKRRGFAQKVQQAQENLGQYIKPENMTTIQAGKVPKKKSDLPVASDAPNVYTPPKKPKPIPKKIKDLLEPYLTPEQMDVIDFGTKPKKKKSSLTEIFYD